MSKTFTVNTADTSTAMYLAEALMMSPHVHVHTTTNVNGGPVFTGKTGWTVVMDGDSAIGLSHVSPLGRWGYVCNDGTVTVSNDFTERCWGLLGLQCPTLRGN